MVSKLGIYCLLAGLFMGLFSGISTFMRADNIWVGLTLSTLLGEAKTESIITTFNSTVIQNALDTFFYNTPLFLLVLFLSGIFLLTSMFLREH